MSHGKGRVPAPGLASMPRHRFLGAGAAPARWPAGPARPSWWVRACSTSGEMTACIPIWRARWTLSRRSSPRHCAAACPGESNLHDADAGRKAACRLSVPACPARPLRRRVTWPRHLPWAWLPARPRWPRLMAGWPAECSELVGLVSRPARADETVPSRNWRRNGTAGPWACSGGSLARRCAGSGRAARRRPLEVPSMRATSPPQDVA
jgi:hypothetical protein